MAHQGFDSLTVDMQHGVTDYQVAVTMLQAISTTPAIPLARVPWNDPAILMKSFDAGVYGVICPMIDSQSEAEALVHASIRPGGIAASAPCVPRSTPERCEIETSELGLQIIDAREEPRESDEGNEGDVGDCRRRTGARAARSSDGGRRGELGQKRSARDEPRMAHRLTARSRPSTTGAMLSRAVMASTIS